MSFEPILLAPEAQEEEIYPYRHVWQTGWLEVGVLAVAVVGVYIAIEFLDLLPVRHPALKAGFALLPLIAWFTISYRAERRAPITRPGLVNVLILGTLVASGIALPLEETIFTPDRWLPTAGFFGRVLGYSFSLGVTAEFLKYAVMRYSVWPNNVNQRRDGIAYAMAVSVGFATVLNLRFALQSDPTLSAVALRVASITYSQVAVGLIMGFFLAELRIGRVPIFWLPVGLFLAALIGGFYYGFRGVAIVSGLSTVGTASSPIRGFFLAFGLIAVMYASLAFIIESADTRMEAITGRRGTL